MLLAHLTPRLTSATPRARLLHRTLASTTSATTTTTISAAVCQDHRELEAYYLRVLQSPTVEVKERYKNQFSWLLAKHAVGEEIVLYPAYEKYMGAFGRAMADKDRESHQQTKHNLEYFQRLYPDSHELEPKLRELMGSLEKHMQAEEVTELPKLEEAMKKHGDAATRSLAKTFRRTQMFIPTRAHPWMPNKPPFETVIGLLSTPIDVLGDVFRKFPDEEDLERTEGQFMNERRRMERQGSGKPT